MAAKGRILFTDEGSFTYKKPTETGYKPKILFTDEDEQQPQEQLGWPGIGQDILKKGAQFIKGIPEAIMSLPKEAGGAIEQIGEPSRFGKNLVAGFGELGHGVLNAPTNLRDYLARKQIISEETPSLRLPESVLPKEYNYPEALGLGEQQPGDALIQGLPAGAAMGPLADVLPNIPGIRSGKRHQKTLKKALEDIETTKKAHAEYLGEGEAHPTTVSQGLVKAIEGEVNPLTGEKIPGYRKRIGSHYDKLSEDMAKDNVTINVTPDIKSIQKEVDRLGIGVTGKERENLLKILSSEGSKKQVSGADALATYRELKHQRGKAYSQAYTPGISPEANKKWIAEGDRLDKLVTKMKTSIDNHLGTKYLDRLKRIDKAYAKIIAPLYENPMYQEMLKHGQTSKNIIKYLHGSTPGNKTLNAIVNKNPEIQRNIVGQQFAENPEKLAKPNAYLNRYAKLNPKISQLIEEQKAIKNFNKTEKPKLEEAISKLQKRKSFRRGAAGGAAATAGVGALEAAFGHDWKQDIPLLASILASKRHSKK